MRTRFVVWLLLLGCSVLGYGWQASAHGPRWELRYQITETAELAALRARAQLLHPRNQVTLDGATLTAVLWAASETEARAFEGAQLTMHVIDEPCLQLAAALLGATPDTVEAQLEAINEGQIASLQAQLEGQATMVACKWHRLTVNPTHVRLWPVGAGLTLEVAQTSLVEDQLQIELSKAAGRRFGDFTAEHVGARVLSRIGPSSRVVTIASPIYGGRLTVAGAETNLEHQYLRNPPLQGLAFAASRRLPDATVTSGVYENRWQVLRALWAMALAALIAWVAARWRWLELTPTRLSASGGVSKLPAVHMLVVLAGCAGVYWLLANTTLWTPGVYEAVQGIPILDRVMVPIVLGTMFIAPLWSVLARAPVYPRVRWIRLPLLIGAAYTSYRGLSWTTARVADVGEAVPFWTLWFTMLGAVALAFVLMDWLDEQVGVSGLAVLILLEAGHAIVALRATPELLGQVDLGPRLAFASLGWVAATWFIVAVRIPGPRPVYGPMVPAWLPGLPYLLVAGLTYVSLPAPLWLSRNAISWAVVGLGVVVVLVVQHRAGRTVRQQLLGGGLTLAYLCGGQLLSTAIGLPLAVLVGLATVVLIDVGRLVRMRWGHGVLVEVSPAHAHNLMALLDDAMCLQQAGLACVVQNGALAQWSGGLLPFAPVRLLVGHVDASRAAAVLAQAHAEASSSAFG